MKLLYGFTYASQWNIKLTSSWLDDNYKQSPHNYSLFTKQQGADAVIILIYIDDFLITRNSFKHIGVAKQFFHSRFKVKDLYELKYFLELKVLRSKNRILLIQRKYFVGLISEEGLSGAKLASSPFEPNIKRTNITYNDYVGGIDDPLLVDVGSHQKLLGKLIT